MDSTPYVNVAATRKSEVGQKLLILLKEKIILPRKKFFLNINGQNNDILAC